MISFPHCRSKVTMYCAAIQVEAMYIIYVCMLMAWILRNRKMYVIINAVGAGFIRYFWPMTWYCTRNRLTAMWGQRCLHTHTLKYHNAKWRIKCKFSSYIHTCVPVHTFIQYYTRQRQLKMKWWKKNDKIAA